MAQLHVIGELVGGKDFPSANLFCKFGIVAGPDWRLLEGMDSGQTQVSGWVDCGCQAPIPTPPHQLVQPAHGCERRFFLTVFDSFSSFHSDKYHPSSLPSLSDLASCVLVSCTLNFQFTIISSQRHLRSLSLATCSDLNILPPYLLSSSSST